MTPAAPSRRALIGGVLGAAALGRVRARADDAVVVRIGNDASPRPISPFVYGSNEIGTLDGGAPSGVLDRAAGVAARRFGGNFATTYNWTNNASNAGKDHRHANGDFFGGLIGLPEAERREPGAVIARMHETSLAMGAISVVTLPLAGFVAADADGPVPPRQAAPSPRFVPVRWSGATPAEAAVDRAVADIPHLLARLLRRFGPASGPTGIRAYALDNEPDLWAETHPRIVGQKLRIADLLARSVTAAAAIKRIDPSALVIGPASWGATGMATFQNAPDWPHYRRFGSVLAAYLDAFRRASDAAGHRLLDALDVHWYPFSARGALYRTEDPALAPALLAAPRSLTESGFREESWVADALPVSDTGGLALPLLPSLDRLAADRFPGTRIVVGEFNYGGVGQLASGLALADALGRFGRAGTLMALHWGSLDGWLAQAFRLYRDYDGRGGRFGAESLPAGTSRPDAVSAHAAAGPEGRLHAILVNASPAAQAVDLVLAEGRPGAAMRAYGFDAVNREVGAIGASAILGTGPVRLLLPGRAARHLVIDRV